MTISVGDLDRRITVQIRTIVPDQSNDPIPEWKDAFQLWAKKADQRGFETVAAQQVVRTADTVFEVRALTRAKTIHPESHRVVYNGKIFEIISVQEGKTRGESLQLLTSSRPDGIGARGQGGVDNV